MIEHTKLLYVEDDMEVIENIKYLMAPYFTEIEIAQDGKEALKKFITFDPDVIVTDIQMPNMNGLEFVKNIREVDDKLPIVFLTAHNDSDKLMQAIELGAVAYVKKPFSLEVLKNAINKAIRTSMEHRKNSELLKEMDILNDNIIKLSTDLKGTITHVSGALLELSGYTQSELVGKNVSIFRSGQTKEETYKELWSCISQGKEWRGELQNSRKDESFYWVSLYITPLFGKDRSIQGYNSLQTDISAKIAAQSQAVRDSLTALYNRVLFNETLENMINISKRGNMYLSFLMLDIDHFKLYNDTYGHSHGDKALTSVGKVLKTYVSRATDYAFRLGGEEFALIIVGLDEAKSLALANRVRESIIDLKIEHEKNTVHRYLSVSIGLYCTKGLEIDNGEFIYAQADNALYQSKRDRRNSVTIFNGKG